MNPQWKKQLQLWNMRRVEERNGLPKCTRAGWWVNSRIKCRDEVKVSKNLFFKENKFFFFGEFYLTLSICLFERFMQGLLFLNTQGQEMQRKAFFAGRCFYFVNNYVISAHALICQDTKFSVAPDKKHSRKATFSGMGAVWADEEVRLRCYIVNKKWCGRVWRPFRREESYAQHIGKRPYSLWHCQMSVSRSMSGLWLQDFKIKG